jgi:hypothetical protein
MLTVFAKLFDRGGEFGHRGNLACSRRVRQEHRYPFAL